MKRATPKRSHLFQSSNFSAPQQFLLSEPLSTHTLYKLTVSVQHTAFYPKHETWPLEPESDLTGMVQGNAIVRSYYNSLDRTLELTAGIQWILFSPPLSGLFFLHRTRLEKYWIKFDMLDLHGDCPLSEHIVGGRLSHQAPS